MKKISYVEMVKTLLPENEYAAFKHHYNKPLQKSIKILTSKTDVSTFSERVAKDGRTLKTPNFSRKGKYYDDVLLVEKSNKQSLGSHPLHQEGYFYVQEMAAGLAAQMLQLQPGDIVLDLCAAPGGKSIQLADKLLSLSLQKGNRRETTKNSGLLISNEPSPKRRKALQANLERCGIRNALITGYDGRQLGQLLQGQCDKVLLDAPCSGEGMQYKADCKIYQRNEKAVKKLAHLQKQLLIAGLNALKGGGELVYSTCTTNTIENEGVVASVLETLGDCVELMNVNIEEKSSGIAPNLTSKVARFRPHLHHTGGFFIAKFKRTSPNTSKWCNKTTTNIFDSTTTHPTPKEQHWNYSPALQDDVRNYLTTIHPLQQENTVPWNHTTSWTNTSPQPTPFSRRNNPTTKKHLLFLQTKHTIRAVAKSALPFLNTLFIQQTGIPLIKILNDGTRKLKDQEN